MISRIIYASTATPSGLAELDEMLAAARISNARNGITGGLILLDDTFMQYIEGEGAAVEGLYARIERDSRHRAVTLLERGQTVFRAFPTWTMARLQWSDGSRALVRAFIPSGPLKLHALDRGAAAPLVRALSQMAVWDGATVPQPPARAAPPPP